jgi:hypothetical protein
LPAAGCLGLRLGGGLRGRVSTGRPAPAGYVFPVVGRRPPPPHDHLAFRYDYPPLRRL